MTDIDRPRETNADMMRIKPEAQENINVEEQVTLDTIATPKTETSVYTKIRPDNGRQVNHRLQECNT